MSAVDVFEVVDQAALAGIDAHGVVLRRMAQVAVDQQRALGLVEGERGGEVAGDEAAAAAAADRRDQGDEVAVDRRQQARAQFAEGVDLGSGDFGAVDQGAFGRLRRCQRIGLRSSARWSGWRCGAR